jgi:2-polyprenyl-6-hydroxyphenyl methylase/3-demethylubiquinone-9 3-methyltransferase
MNKQSSHDNVDDEEIRKFSDLASRWWDPQSEFKPLHEINPLRLGFINKHSPLEGKKVLDVGCGGGILSESMAVLGANVTGIDMGEAPLNVARLHAMESGQTVDYRKITAEQLADEQPKEWDVVTCMEMLEHVPDPFSIVEACSKLAKPGGAVYFSTLNRNPKSFMFAIVGAEYVLNMLPRGTHQYGKFIRPSELDKWCEQTKLTTHELTGMHFNILTKSYRLGPGLDVNYLSYTTRDQD